MHDGRSVSGSRMQLRASCSKSGFENGCHYGDSIIFPPREYMTSFGCIIREQALSVTRLQHSMFCRIGDAYCFVENICIV